MKILCLFITLFSVNGAAFGSGEINEDQISINYKEFPQKFLGILFKRGDSVLEDHNIKEQLLFSKQEFYTGKKSLLDFWGEEPNLHGTTDRIKALGKVGIEYVRLEMCVAFINHVYEIYTNTVGSDRGKAFVNIENLPIYNDLKEKLQNAFKDNIVKAYNFAHQAFIKATNDRNNIEYNDLILFMRDNPPKL
jgi:hypothetical protein